MKRYRTIIAAAAVFIAALSGFLLLWQPKQPDLTTAAVQAVPAEIPAEATPDAPTQPAAPAPAIDDGKAPEPVANIAPAQQATSETQAAPTPSQMAALVPPAFDVVRVEPNGEAVIAGRAMVGSDVSVLDGGISLGRVTTDGRGQWVFVVDPPLTPGSHELGLEARLADGRVVASADVVVINVPLPQVAAAPQGSPQQPAASGSAAGTASPTAPSTAQSPASTADAAQATTGTGTTLSPAGAAAEQPLAVLMPRTGQGPSKVLQQSVSRQDGLVQGTLVLESIDYDERGAIIGGRAEPGARLVVYLDDIALGEVNAGSDGRWSLVLDRPLQTGLHRLRVDAVDGQGNVIARVETPFSRASLAEVVPDETSVIVQPGNSLWRIARRIYGEGLRYALIFEANEEQIRNPDLIYPGQIFKVPMTTPAAAPAN